MSCHQQNATDRTCVGTVECNLPKAICEQIAPERPDWVKEEMKTIMQKMTDEHKKVSREKAGGAVIQLSAERAEADLDNDLERRLREYVAKYTDTDEHRAAMRKMADEHKKGREHAAGAVLQLSAEADLEKELERLQRESVANHTDKMADVYTKGRASASCQFGKKNDLLD